MLCNPVCGNSLIIGRMTLMDIAIDLGTDRTRIYINGKGKVIDEASIVAKNTGSNKIIAIGNRAHDMLGKTPVSIETVYPIENGVIAHSELAENMLAAYVKEVCPVRATLPRVVASIPCRLTEVEKQAVLSTVNSFGARKIYLIEAPKAAALGCGADISGAHGIMIAHIGGSSAEIAVISLGRITVSKTINMSGDYMDKEITSFVKKRYKLLIGKNTAEKCKIEIGSLSGDSAENYFRLKGRDAVSGLPKYIDISSREIYEAILPTATAIAGAINSVLEHTPPELARDIYNDGIILTGGLARLNGLARFICEKSRLRVKVHKESGDCVISGCAKAIRLIPQAEKAARSGITPILAAY